MSHTRFAFMKKIIERLATSYQKFPFDFDSQEPLNWFEEFSKKDIDSIQDEDVTLFLHEVSKMDCFSYRAVNTTPPQNIYFNPLEQSFGEFRTSDTIIYQTEYPYPTPDMIIAWCHSQREA